MARTILRTTRTAKIRARSTDAPSPVGASTIALAPASLAATPPITTDRSAMQCTISARSARTILQRLNKIAHAPQRAETSPLALESRSTRKSFGLEPLAVGAHARRHDDLKSAFPRRLRHRQEMRNKKPVFGDEVKDFGHDGRRFGSFQGANSHQARGDGSDGAVKYLCLRSVASQASQNLQLRYDVVHPCICRIGT